MIMVFHQNTKNFQDFGGTKDCKHLVI